MIWQYTHPSIRARGTINHQGIVHLEMSVLAWRQQRNLRSDNDFIINEQFARRMMVIMQRVLSLDLEFLFCLVRMRKSVSVNLLLRLFNGRDEPDLVVHGQLSLCFESALITPYNT